jgi:hypothetical protein
MPDTLYDKVCLGLAGQDVGVEMVREWSDSPQPYHTHVNLASQA